MPERRFWFFRTTIQAFCLVIEKGAVDYGPDVKAAYDYAKEIWAIYQNRVKAVYANVAAKTATASLKDGNICVRQSPNHYVCGYSLRPEEDSD